MFQSDHFQPHDAEKINQQLQNRAGVEMGSLTYLPQVDSTSSWLSRQQEKRTGSICLTDFQSGGRGRRGRSWLAPAGSSVMFSILWQFNRRDMSGLSLAIGCAAVNALKTCGVSNVMLKWPNDLLLNQAKLGGVLVESSGQRVIIGVGVNVNVPFHSMDKVEQAWIDLKQAGISIDRDKLAIELISSVREALNEFDDNGFEAFVTQWRDVHAYQDCEVEIQQPGCNRRGIVEGIDKGGALLVRFDTGLETILSAEVSLRPLGITNDKEMTQRSAP